ncbi:MAG: MobA/MobL family protein [Defluviitaleaceae bacterium]|nr:MobA/MobL family protein [Defluviitaleaceae bacterium]
MAFFYMDVKIIGGGSGRTAVGAAAYRTGENLLHERDGIRLDYTKRRGAVGAAAYRAGEKLNEHDFTHKSEIVHNEIMLPSHAPEIYRDRETLWNAAEKAERNHNARTGREIVVALPNELTREQQIKVVRDYVQRQFVNEGMCVDFSIHAGHIHDRPNEEYPFENLTIRKENPHAHIQLTVRPINEDGTWRAKSKKEYILDRNGERIRLASGNWKSRKVDSTDWDKTETLLKWREDWAVIVNREFERLGMDERISHLSLKAQGIDREPTVHMGHKAWNLEKKGIRTAVGDRNRAILERNKSLEQREKKAIDHEPSMREKLASVRNEQKQANGATIRDDEHFNAMQDAYKEIERDLQWCADKRREIQRLEHRAKEMAQRAVQIRDPRGREIFKRNYGVEPEEASAEVLRNNERAYALMQELKRQESELMERKNEIEIEIQIMRKRNIQAEYLEEMEKKRSYGLTR